MNPSVSPRPSGSDAFTVVQEDRVEEIVAIPNHRQCNLAKEVLKQKTSAPNSS
jgi:hypothetical protein